MVVVVVVVGGAATGIDMWLWGIVMTDRVAKSYVE